jgi:hypothetical protein
MPSHETAPGVITQAEALVFEWNFNKTELDNG